MTILSFIAIKSANYASSAFGNENCARYDGLRPKIMLAYIKAKTRDVTQLSYTLRDTFWVSDHCLPLMGQANECLMNFFQAIGLFDTKKYKLWQRTRKRKIWFAPGNTPESNIVSWLRSTRSHKVTIICLVVSLITSPNLKNLSGERLKPDQSTLILRKTCNVPFQTKMKNSSTVDNIPQQIRYFNLLNSLFAKIIKPQSNKALTHNSPTITTRKLFIEPLEIFRAITEKLLRGYCSH